MVWPFLVSNETCKASGALSRCGEMADRVDVAVAYLSSSEPLRSWLTNGLSIKLVIALQPPTDANVVRSLANAYPKRLETKFYSAGFHSKLFIFYRDGKPFCAHVGSSNLTNGGLNSNLETNVLLREPQQLKELVEHFHRIWIRSADLEPTDIDHYKQHCEDIAGEAAKIRKRQQDFEGRFVRPRISRVTTSRIFKEARDYLRFWKTVDEVLKAFAPVLKKQFPGIPPYLAVDHFWHWLVKVWDQKGINRLRASPKKRDARLPQLFEEYATWYKSEPGYSRVALTRHSDATP